MRSLSNEMSPLALQVFMDLLVKTGDNRAELGKKLVENIPVYQKMLKDRARPAANTMKKTVDKTDKVVAKTADLVSRSIHQLLLKHAQIPRAAMPWMKAVQKVKRKGGIVPQAPKGTAQPLHQRPETSFATPGGAPELTPKSIKSVSQMVGGKLVRTKFK